METDKKTCLITGATSGIGKAMAVELIKQNYSLVVLARDSTKTIQAISELKRISPRVCIEWVPVDLSEANSVKAACHKVKSEWTTFDLILNNAGVYKRRPVYSSDGVEISLATNFGAPFLISRLMGETLKVGRHSMIMNVTSALYTRGTVPDVFPVNYPKYKGGDAYAIAKLLVLLDTHLLADYYTGKDVRVNCVHPGVVATDVFRDYPAWFNKMLNPFIMKAEDSAGMIMPLISSEGVEAGSGNYYYKNRRKRVKNLELLLERYKKLETQVVYFYGV